MCTTFQHIYEAVIGVTNRGGFGRSSRTGIEFSFYITRRSNYTVGSPAERASILDARAICTRHRGKMKRSLVSAAIPSPISPVLTSRMLFLSIQNAISFRVDREPYRNDIVIYPQICQIDIDRRCVLFPTFFNRPYLFGRKFNQSSYSSSLKQIRRM